MAEADTNDLKQRLIEACQAGNFEQLARLSIEALDDTARADQDLLGWIAKIVSDNGLAEAFSTTRQCEDDSRAPR